MNKPFIQSTGAFAVCVLLLVTLFICADFDSPEQRAERSQSQAVMISLDGGWGSGVIFNRRDANGFPRTYVWTAGHVAEASKRCSNVVASQEILHNGQIVGALTNKLKLVRVFAGTDLAVFEAENPHTYVSSARFAPSQVLRVGQEITHVGSYYGPAAHNSFASGRITYPARLYAPENVKFVQTDAVAYPGSSGGPVFNKSGEVVGLLVFSRAPGINGFIPIGEWRRIVFSEGLGWLMDAKLPLPLIPSLDKTVFGVDIRP